ncbi:MAG: hypothetical protein E2603_04530 [Achromobacter sp.]|nr:hypothetical protein [Achromobacter sp.]
MKAQTLTKIQRDLKPCAHCGSRAGLKPMPHAPLWFRVRCENYHCGVTTWAMQGEDEAAEAWNRRVHGQAGSS